MCNAYNITTNQQAIRSFVSITHDIIGNMEPSIDVYPDRMAPIVQQRGSSRTGDGSFQRMRDDTFGIRRPPSGTMGS